MTEVNCGTVQVEQLVVGFLESNCYIAYCTESRKAIIIDPGEDADNILEIIERLNLKPAMIVNTHAHGDHIGAIREIKERFDIPLAIHEADAEMLVNPNLNLSSMFGLPIAAPPADILLKDNDTIEFEDRVIKVLHTPGHTPGGISLLLDKHLFTGDALFRMTIGRTDFPGASHEQLIQAIRDKILPLPDDTIVYPGHGGTTTVGDERKDNPYLQ